MTICLDLAEKVLKLRTLKCAFLCILNDGFGSWKWWDNVESTGNRYCTLTLKENIVFGSWNTWEQFELNDDNMVHSGAIWNDVLKVGTTEIFFKARTQNDALWCYLKRFIWRWNCWEKIKSKDAKWCILMLFETMFLKLELLGNLKSRTQNGAFGRCLKRCLGSWNTWAYFESKDAKWCILPLFETIFIGSLKAMKTRKSLEARNAPKMPIAYTRQNL